MSGLLTDVGATAAGYAIGSIPFGLLVGRAAGGIDVRDVGSGSMGSTNVLRTVGPAPAALTLALDVAKGTGAVLLARAVGAGPNGQVSAGLAAVVGHSWPVFAGFRGGKSVATGFGALLAISPEVAAWAVVGGGGALAKTHIVSAGSLTAACTATLGAAVIAARGGSRRPLVYAAVTSALIINRHSANIGRLVRGVEPRVTLKPRRVS